MKAMGIWEETHKGKLTFSFWDTIKSQSKLSKMYAKPWNF